MPEDPARSVVIHARRGVTADSSRRLHLLVSADTVFDMPMTLRLTEEETEALRRKARDEGRSMNEVARTAINAYTRDEDQAFRSMVSEIVDRDRELLDRLAR